MHKSAVHRRPLVGLLQSQIIGNRLAEFHLTGVHVQTAIYRGNEEPAAFLVSAVVIGDPTKLPSLLSHETGGKIALDRSRIARLHLKGGSIDFRLRPTQVLDAS
jgi:hypothetical protein